MDFEAYKRTYFVSPPPEQKFNFKNSFAVTLYFEDYKAAIAFYEEVLGPPGYIEGDGTRGWSIGNGWLTLLKGKLGNPKNVEITFELETVEEAEALQSIFIEAGASGETPSNQLMYRPIRSCPVVDPFGTQIMIIYYLPTN